MISSKSLCCSYVILMFIDSYSVVLGLPSYCFDYYSEFSLDQDYNPTIYPEVNTTITDITTLYKISEVSVTVDTSYSFEVIRFIILHK